MANKAFQAGGNSMSARQFGFTMEEALKFADADPSKVAILKATVPESILPKLDFSKTIDPFIFKNGVITVHPEMQPLFNQSLKAVEHVY
jgi:filamentous hemagglutinin